MKKQAELFILAKNRYVFSRKIGLYWTLTPRVNVLLGDLYTKTNSRIVTDTAIITVGKNTIIEAGTRFSGKIKIGNNCYIGKSAYLYNSIIGNNVFADEKCNIHSSKIYSNNFIPMRYDVGSCIIHSNIDLIHTNTRYISGSSIIMIDKELYNLTNKKFINGGLY